MELDIRYVLCAHMKLTVPCYSVLYNPRFFCRERTTYFWIIFTFVPFSKSNNFTHAAHNGGTEGTLNQRENACFEYDKRGDFYCPYSHRLACVKLSISDQK